MKNEYFVKTPGVYDLPSRNEYNRETIINRIIRFPGFSRLFRKF